MLRIVVMVSGGGTNLQAIIDGVKNGTITNTEIAGVISNNRNAHALERAEKSGIPNRCVSPKDMRAGRSSMRSFSRRWTSTARI